MLNLSNLSFAQKHDRIWRNLRARIRQICGVRGRVCALKAATCRRTPNQVLPVLGSKTLEGLIHGQYRRLHRRRASLRNVDAYPAAAFLRILPGSGKRIDARPGRTFVIEQNAIVRAKARSSHDN